MTSIVAQTALSIWLLLCVVNDLYRRRLPNKLMMAGCILGIIFFFAEGKSIVDSTPSSIVFAVLVSLLITLPGYALHWLGAGDVKMFATLGLMTGLQFMLLSFVIAGMLSGFVLLYSVVSRRYVPFLNLHLAKIGWQLPPTSIFNGKSLPFGALLAFGGLLVLAFHITGMMNAVAVA